MSSERAAPLVSVIIPAFNSAPYLRHAIDSVLAQSHRPLEVIVVDDGSTDGTASIAREFGAPVRVIEQANGGAAQARNRGMHEAQGEYIAFLDADDYWHPRKLEAQLRHLQSCDDCVAVYCNKIDIRNGEAPTFTADSGAGDELGRLTADGPTSGWLYLELLRDSVVHTSTILAARDTFARVGTFDECLRKGQDLDFWLRLSHLGPIHRLEAVLSAYRVHPDSISHTLTPTNYHALVLERALRQFGPGDPAGNALRAGEAAEILKKSWVSFAYQHYCAGSLTIAKEAIRRAEACGSEGPGTQLLALRIWLKSWLHGWYRPLAERRRS